jgi:septal ring factor EnvC (AmiA/AmiB activator)
MVSATDMSTPVTRGELRDAIAPLATKVDLELWGGALLERIKSGEQRLGSVEQRLGSVEQRLDSLEQHIDRTERRLSEELARHANVICETLAKQISASAEAYADLPGRVSRLEAAVFTPAGR